MSTSRRGFLAAAPLWTRALQAAQIHAHSQAPDAEAYRYRFFKPEERRTLQALAALLIPADERSGGAPAARVDEYIDFVLSHAEPALQRRWRAGIRVYSSLPADRRDERLGQASRGEFRPRTAEEEFFVLLKGAVAEGFYTSQEGIQRELGYQGLAFLREFTGCTHEKHETPADYQALLTARS